MNLEPLAMRLQVMGIGQLGKTIFVDDMPSDATQGVLLRGPRLGTPIDHELPGYRKTSFNIAVRGKTHKAGKELANKVVTALTISDEELTGMDVRYIRPETEPVVFPISDAGIFEFLVIFEAVYVIV